nr:hypothetical protein [Metallosphaera hakonensis]
MKLAFPEADEELEVIDGPGITDGRPIRGRTEYQEGVLQVPQAPGGHGQGRVLHG